jgi:hypothetical protein
MVPALSLSPRYCLNDQQNWLNWLDPHHSWIRVNGCADLKVRLPGLAAASGEEFRSVLRQLRALQPGSELQLIRSASVTTIYRVSDSCYAIFGQVNDPINGPIDGLTNGPIGDVPIMHLFDPETLESLLHASYPDGSGRPQTLDWEHCWLSQSWERAIAA